MKIGLKLFSLVPIEIDDKQLLFTIIISGLVLYNLLKSKKKESKTNFLLTIISLLVTFFLFYNFYKNYL